MNASVRYIESSSGAPSIGEAVSSIPISTKLSQYIQLSFIRNPGRIKDSGHIEKCLPSRPHISMASVMAVPSRSQCTG